MLLIIGVLAFSFAASIILAKNHVYSRLFYSAFWRNPPKE